MRLFFFISGVIRERDKEVRKGEPILKNKNEPAIDLARRRARVDGFILIDRDNRIVDAEKLERYFALPILFFTLAQGQSPGRCTSDWNGALGAGFFITSIKLC